MGTVDKLTELQFRRNKIEQGGGEAKIKKQHDSNKMTARERINALMDEGSFVEIDAFVSHRCTEFGMDAVEAPGEGVVTGYGTVGQIVGTNNSTDLTTNASGSGIVTDLVQ